MIDPWGSEKYEYDELFEKFGIEKFNRELWADLPNPPFFFRRGIVFGHRGFGNIKEAIKRGMKWKILTGLMPSGKMHLGHKIVIDQVIYYQSIGADVSIAVADLEAYATRDISLEEGKKIAIDEYILNYIALGLKPCRIYFQSKNEEVKDLAYLMAKKSNFSQVNSIYGFQGSTNMMHIFAPFIQIGDILHVQLDEYGGICPTLVPVGVDQDPHIRFCRDLANAHRIYSIVEEKDRVGIFIKGKEDAKKFLDIAEEIINNFGSVIERIDNYRAIYARINDLFSFEYELARAERKNGHHGFLLPSSTYHRFITGLDGNKMSSSRPNYAIFLSDELNEVKKKIWIAKTGGAISADEQRKKGGKPEECIIYEIFNYIIESDDEIKNIEERCKKGESLCGDCKKYAYEILSNFLKELKERRETARDEIKEYI